MSHYYKELIRISLLKSIFIHNLFNQVNIFRFQILRNFCKIFIYEPNFFRQPFQVFFTKIPCFFFLREIHVFDKLLKFLNIMKLCIFLEKFKLNCCLIALTSGELINGLYWRFFNLFFKSNLLSRQCPKTLEVNNKGFFSHFLIKRIKIINKHLYFDIFKTIIRDSY